MPIRVLARIEVQLCMHVCVKCGLTVIKAWWIKMNSLPKQLCNLKKCHSVYTHTFGYWVNAVS